MATAMLVAVHTGRRSAMTHPARARDKEESSEFAGLRSATRPAERTAMAAALRVASALAPTHPHPGNESASRALLVGTPMAMMDRARDLLRNALPGRTRETAPDAPSA
jgi:hypothetical protein